MVGVPGMAGARIRTLIVDDEEPARLILREYLAEHDTVEVVGECGNGLEAVKTVTERAGTNTAIDLMFLDIQMPKLDGFDVVELLPEPRPAIVFVTAYDEHALRAFEVHALDYLLKPFAPERLTEALDRVVQRAGAGTEPPVPVEAILDRPGHQDRILVREGSQIHVLASHRLDYAEAQDDVVVLVSEGRKLRKPGTLTALAKRLDPKLFVQIHRSYLLNLDRLDRLELYAKDSRVAILRDGTRLPVSRSGYGRLREFL